MSLLPAPLSRWSLPGRSIWDTDPPIKIRRCWLDSVPAYSGFGAVDLYLGNSRNRISRWEKLVLTSRREPQALRGGGHVISDLIAGNQVQLRALDGNRLLPRASFETTITRETINQFYLFNPNLYQISLWGKWSDHPLFTYLGPLQPRLSSAVYSILVPFPRSTTPTCN